MYNYLIIIEQAEGNFSAYSPDVDGCTATGRTTEEARKNFLEALEFHIEGLNEEGLEIPEPSSKIAFCSEDCSGVLNVRVKKSLHYKLIKLAEQEGVSVSHLVNDALVEKYSEPKEENIFSNIEPSVTEDYLKHIATKRFYEGKPPELTEREKEVLELVVKGTRTHSIASKLSISDKTVKTRICSILQKLNSFEPIKDSICQIS